MFGKNKKLTEERWILEQMYKILNTKWTNKTCECCGSKEWSFAEDLTQHRCVSPEFKNKCYISITVFCENCGNVKSFSISKFFPFFRSAN